MSTATVHDPPASKVPAHIAREVIVGERMEHTRGARLAVVVLGREEAQITFTSPLSYIQVAMCLDRANLVEYRDAINAVLAATEA